MSSSFLNGHELPHKYNVKKDAIVLGISSYLHDSSICFLRNGKILYASQEERHTRIKNDNSFPFLAILNGLSYLNLDKKEIKDIIFHESLNYIKKKEKNKIKDRLLADLSFINIKKPNLQFLDHHYSHAAAGYFSSNFSDALIFTFDGMGESVSTSVFYGKNNDLKNIKKIHEPNSLGLLYSAFTYFLGFDVNSGEYKMMGLSPFGKNIYEEKILNELIEVFEDGSFIINNKYFNFFGEKEIITKELENFFLIKKRKKEDKILNIHCDLAASIQSVIEKIIFKIISFEIKKHDTDNIVLGGGVALNCVANGKIEKLFKKKLHIFPSPGDSGNAYGCAAYATFSSKEHKDLERSEIKNVFIGSSYDKNNNDVISLCKIFDLNYYEFFNYKNIVDLLVDKKIIGFFNGRSEFGPRSLGNRSIIADPRNSDAQKKINLKIKFRESFRPFAPIVLCEFAHEYFEGCTESPYMQKTYYVKSDKLINSNDLKLKDIFEKINEKRSLFPAITHVDNSARVQTVSDKELPIHKLLTEFYKATGCPMLVNTSFNVNNEPIVETPFDAIKTFINTNIDYLVIDNLILSKKN